MTTLSHLVAGWDIGIRNEDTVIGHDSECADYSNPTGAIYALVWYVVATHPKGWRYAHVQSHREEVNAVLQADMIQARIEDHEKAIELNDDWVECDPAYGSEAYIEMEAHLVDREVAEDMDRCFSF